VRSVNQWLTAYGASHVNPVNELLHAICVPLIVLAVLGLLWSLPVPASIAARAAWLNWATLAAAASLVYYASLSVRLAAGMAPLLALMAWALASFAGRALPLWQVSVAVFIIAWIGQFVGHLIEGRRPSFFEDVQFLLIGPLWLLSLVYRRLGWRY
jgi:uncharacterized membrane protein YGL010W